jgi:tetratricopeptide (TPR) repeat protein
MEKGRGSQASEANLASIKASLAQVYMMEGRPADAQPLLEQAVKVHQAALPATAVDRIFSESGLGTLYAWEGHYAMSHALLDAVSQAASQLGELHPIFAESLVSLADLYRMEGEQSRREPLLRKALYIYEKSLGPDSPRVADTLLDMSLDSLNEGKPAMAEAVLGRALAILRRAFGPDHTMVAVGEYRLAEAYIQLKKTAEARLLLDHALRVEQATYPDGHAAIADCFFALARLEAMQHHDKEAEQYCRTAIGLYEKNAPTSTGLRAALRQYAKLLRTHDSAEAKVLVTRAKQLDQMAKTLN